MLIATQRCIARMPPVMRGRKLGTLLKSHSPVKHEGQSQSVTAIARRSGSWWAIEVPEIPGLFTRTKRLNQVKSTVIDAARLFDIPVKQVIVTTDLDNDDTTLLSELTVARKEAAQAQEKASGLTRAAIRALRSQGLTLNDVSIIIGLTPQRISALQRS